MISAFRNPEKLIIKSSYGKIIFCFLFILCEIMNFAQSKSGIIAAICRTVNPFFNFSFMSAPDIRSPAISKCKEKNRTIFEIRSFAVSLKLLDDAV